MVSSRWRMLLWKPPDLKDVSHIRKQGLCACHFSNNLLRFSIVMNLASGMILHLHRSLERFFQGLLARNLHHLTQAHTVGSLDMDQDPPTQELLVKDLSGREWVFPHIYRGQPKRNLITTGWSQFVTAKRLVAGDRVFFFRGGGRKLLVGFRRASKPRITAPTSFMSSLSLHHGILATAFHALSTRTMFTVYYRPWSCAGEFIIPYDQYVRSAGIGYTPGMRFRMQFENDDNPDYRCITLPGRIIDVEDVYHHRWPDSDWRRLKVQWDGILDAPDLPERVFPWSIELFFRSKTTQLLPVMPSLKRSFPFDPLTPNMPFQVKDQFLCPKKTNEREVRS